MGSLLLWKNATFFDDFVFCAITKIIYHFASLSRVFRLFLGACTESSRLCSSHMPHSSNQLQKGT